jgi:hypothetical protein
MCATNFSSPRTLWPRNGHAIRGACLTRRMNALIRINRSKMQNNMSLNLVRSFESHFSAYEALESQMPLKSLSDEPRKDSRMAHFGLILFSILDHIIPLCLLCPKITLHVGCWFLVLLPRTRASFIREWASNKCLADKFTTYGDTSNFTSVFRLPPLMGAGLTASLPYFNKTPRY